MVTLSSPVVAVGTRAGRFTRYYPDVATMLAAVEAWESGEIIEADRFRFQVAASDATDHHLTAAGNSEKLYVLAGASGFDVRAFGAVGDNSTDDTSAIQAAIDAAKEESGMVFFPPGQYRVNDTLNVDAEGSTNYFVHLVGIGSGAKIRASLNGKPTISMNGFSSGGSGVRGIERMEIFNNASTGGSVVSAGNFVGMFSINQCLIDASGGSDGLVLTGSSFSGKVTNCRIKSSAANGRGILSSGHVLLSNLDMTGWNKGIVLFGTGDKSLNGARIEICNYGLILGEDVDGSARNCDRAHISGLSLEACNYGIWERQFQGIIEGVGIYGSNNAPSGMSKIGMLLDGCAAAYKSIRVLQDHDSAGIRIRTTINSAGTFERVVVSNNNVGEKWDVAGDVDALTFTSCNFPSGSDTITTVIPEVKTRGISKWNYLSDNPRPRNLSGVAVPVTEAANTVAVTFPATLSGTQALINTATATTGGSLAEGTYYYICAGINELGEITASPSNEKSVAITAPNNAATIDLFTPIPTTYRIRVYRGTASGVYDGYYEITSEPFTDTGAAFDGVKAPAASGTAALSAQEPDTNYGVIVTPSWGTTAWVTSKATSGFTINFGTAAPAGATVDWILMR